MVFTFLAERVVMLQRIIPSTGEALPAVGLGTWIQFDVGPSAAERALLQEVLQRMAAGGARVIDSSPMYGRAEAVVGELTQASGVADRFFYATKVWTPGEGSGKKQIAESFRKLQRPTLDLLQIHNLVDWRVHLKTLRRLKEEGAVRYIGITHYQSAAHGQLEEILRHEPIDFVQVNYSIGERHAERSLLPAAQERGVAVLVNRPFEGGSAFKTLRGKALPAWAADLGISSWGQFFLKYILAHPAVTCVIPGTSNPEHLLDNMKAAEGPLPAEAARAKMVEIVERG